MQRIKQLCIPVGIHSHLVRFVPVRSRPQERIDDVQVAFEEYGLDKRRLATLHFVDMYNTHSCKYNFYWYIINYFLYRENFISYIVGFFLVSARLQ